MTLTRKDFGAFFFFLFCLLLFYPELFLAQSASLIRDHIEQHYQWTHLLAESIKRFEIPFWTPLVHSGFPIAAEGQIGAFYPLNLILCFLLPVHLAYAYMDLVHFFIAAAGTYLYARQMRLGPAAAAVSGFIFLFGAAYGGAYYNITSLKTIAWFPFELFFFEQFYTRGKQSALVFLSGAVALSLLAGYFQIALFALFIFCIYAMLRIFIFSERTGRKNKKNFLWLASIGMGIVLALPQIALTFELAQYSTRVGLGRDYAYIGSMSPVAVLTVFFPAVQGMLRGNCLYSGAFSSVLILCAVCAKKNHLLLPLRMWLTMGAIAFLLALGRWSPVFPAFIELTHFYSFRIPSKFLVFVCFGLAMISGIGFEMLLQFVTSDGDQAFISKVRRIYFVLFLAGIFCYALLYYFLTAGRAIAIAGGEWFVRQFVAGKMGHPYALDVYYQKLLGALESMEALLSFQNPWMIWALILLLINFLLLFLLGGKGKTKKMGLVFGAFFLFFDLYAYAFLDIKKDFDAYQHIDKLSPVMETLRSEPAAGRVGRVLGLRSPEERTPLYMVYHIEEIGLYSPLVLKRYYETIGRFGSVNDSNFVFPAEPQFVRDHIHLLDMLAVTHVASKKAIEHPNLKLILHDTTSGVFLYRNQGLPSRAYLVSRGEIFSNWTGLKNRFLEPGFDPRERMLIERSELEKIHIEKLPERSVRQTVPVRISESAGSETWTFEANAPCFFVVTNTYYPGWRAQLNGKTAPILKVYGLFQAVWVERPGRYEIRFQYHPFHFLFEGKFK